MKQGTVIVLCLMGAALLVTAALPAQVDDASRIKEQNKQGVLYLIALSNTKEEIARGTGFAVGEDIVVTNYHLVSPAWNMEAYTFENKKVKVEGILGVNKAANLALLKIKGKPQSLILGNFDIVTPDMKLFAFGVNEAGEIDNIIDSTARQVLQVTPELKAAELPPVSIPLTFSGAPVFDISGQVVGILNVLDRGLKFIIPVNLIRYMTRYNKLVDFKSWTHEDFFGSLEGAMIAGRIAAVIGDAGNAQRFLERVVAASATNVEAQALLAKVYSDQRDYVSATAAYQKVLEFDPNRATAHYELGVVQVKTEKYNEALASFNRALQLGLNNPQVYFYMGNAYEARKDFALAVEQYGKYLLTNPEDQAHVQFRLGACAMEVGQYDRAASAFQESLKSQPRDFQTNYNLALAYQKAKQYEKAEEVFRRLIQFFPEDAASYYSSIVRMYDEAGMNEKAVEAARKVVELNPKNEVAVYNLGIMYQKLKRHDEAIAAFQQALALKPNYEYAWFNIGICYSQQKKYRESIDAFKKYTEIVPDSAEGFLNIGVNYMYLKDYAGAVEPLKKSISLRPDYGVAIYNLGITYLNLKAYDSARETYQTLVGVDAALANQLRRLLR